MHTNSSPSPLEAVEFLWIPPSQHPNPLPPTKTHNPEIKFMQRFTNTNRLAAINLKAIFNTENGQKLRNSYTGLSL